jgi:hypothetical protein
VGTGAAWPRSALREVPFRHAAAVEEDHEGGYTNGREMDEARSARAALEAAACASRYRRRRGIKWVG